MCISTHALTEGDLPECYEIYFATRISTHALTEGDDGCAEEIAEYECISTHALTEGDDDVDVLCFQRRYFNSRPHGGRPACFVISTSV